MTRKIVITAVVVALTAAGYLLYRYYFPALVAKAIVSETLPGYLPESLQTKIKSVQQKANESAEDLVQQIRTEKIPLEKVLTLIDNTTEEEAYRFLDDINLKKPQTTDEVFNIAKDHFKADFDFEILRKPFNENVSLQMINKAIAHTNHTRQSKKFNINTTKAIVKKVLIEKEKELRSSHRNTN